MHKIAQPARSAAEMVALVLQHRIDQMLDLPFEQIDNDKLIKLEEELKAVKRAMAPKSLTVS